MNGALRWGLVSVLTFVAASASYAEGKRIAATPSAERSAPGHGPELAVDRNAETLWLASAQPDPENNTVWFQLDLGSVKPVARLHWRAARGTPYPASAPRRYRVLLSTDGSTWTPVAVSSGGRDIEYRGNVLLNADARFVRLATTQVNDGTGWALGLHEIWVTEGREPTEVARKFRPRVEGLDGAVRLRWTVPEGLDIREVRIYGVDHPRAKRGDPLASVAAGAGRFVDRVPNWTPRYYRLEAVDAGGAAVLESALAVGVARPAERSEAGVETFAFWYEPYKASTDADASIKRIGEAAFVVGPGFEAAADLARLGKGLLPYVTFYQTSGWAPAFAASADPQRVADAIAPVAFLGEDARFPGSPPGYVPSVFCRPGNVEYNPASVFYTACPNSGALREKALAHVRKQLDGGVRGFFVDNGYEDDIAARAGCESTAHAHFYGDGLTSADAFLGLLLDVTCAVKSRRPDGVVMVNGGVPPDADFYGLGLGDVSDGQLWESYLRSSYHTPKDHVYDWQDVYRQSVALEKAWHATPPRRMFVLSYPWNRDEAYFCYATAKLCHLPWSASLGVSDPEHRQFGGHFGTYPELVGLRLGPPAKAEQFGGFRVNGVYVREYERGLIVVNPAHSSTTAQIPLGRPRRYREAYSGHEGEGDSVHVDLPAESGRVYRWR